VILHSLSFFLELYLQRDINLVVFRRFVVMKTYLHCVVYYTGRPLLWKTCNCQWIWHLDGKFRKLSKLVF